MPSCATWALIEETIADVPVVEEHATAVLEPERIQLCQLRRARRNGLRTLEVVQELPRRHGRKAGGQDDRQNRRGRELRTSEHSSPDNGGPEREDQVRDEGNERTGEGIPQVA